MPLFEVAQTRYLRAPIRLADTSAMQVDQYATFIHAVADEAVEQALAYVFAKDKDFQEFLRTPEAKRITPTLRIRRVPVPNAAEQSAKQRGSAAQSAAQTQ